MKYAILGIMVFITFALYACCIAAGMRYLFAWLIGYICGVVADEFASRR